MTDRLEEARARVLAARNNVEAMARGAMPVLPGYLAATVSLLDQAAEWLEGSA